MKSGGKNDRKYANWNCVPERNQVLVWNDKCYWRIICDYKYSIDTLTKRMLVTFCWSLLNLFKENKMGDRGGRAPRGRGGGRLTAGQRPVSESTRIDISLVLAEFQASNETGTFKTICTPQSIRFPSIGRQHHLHYHTSTRRSLNPHPTKILTCKHNRVCVSAWPWQSRQGSGPYRS